jgi:LysM domain
MSSLTTHLRRSVAHDRLPFHPSCPICRSRLVGTAPTDEVLSPRIRAALAAGVLALSATAPVATAAAQEGAPVAAGGDSADSAGSDPGGASTDLPDSPEPTAEPAPASDDAGGQQDDASADVTDPVVDHGDDSSSSPSTPPPSSTPAAPTPVPAASAPAPTAPAPSAPAPTTSTPPAARPRPTSVPTASAVVRRDRRVHVGVVYVRRSHRVRHMTALAAPAELGTAATQVTRRPKPMAFIETGGLRHDADTHVVQPGESLWFIAARVVGRRATPAQIAREVHRLWTLNKGRIRTGDPDLLMVGTRLVLR